VAKYAKVDQSAEWYIGEDKTVRISVKQADGTTAQTMTGWAEIYELLDRQGGTVLFSKTTGAGEITFDNDAGTDDRALIAVTDADTEGLANGAGWYYHVLRRTDAGSEGVIAEGGVLLKKASI
jgi:hypothetical protein